MKFAGLQTQIWRNNSRSIILLILFPVLLYVLTFFFFVIFGFLQEDIEIDAGRGFLFALPWITVLVLFWFLIAYSSHTRMIKKATGSKTLERKSNKRVYNLVENLAMTAGMKMPNVNIIEDDSLNAFASGLNNRTYTVSLSRGIIDKLDDKELEGVIAHELTHIRNRDVRLLVVSIVFVGIFAFLTQALLRSMRFRGGGNKKGNIAIVIVILLAAIGWLLSTVFRFALSRKREYMADAGAVEITKNPEAMASALKKISVDSRIEAVQRKDVAQMFIDNPGEKKKSSVSSMFSTHPPIEERIRILNQF